MNAILLMGTIPSSEAPETSCISAHSLMKLYIFVFFLITSIV